MATSFAFGSSPAAGSTASSPFPSSSAPSAFAFSQPAAAAPSPSPAFGSSVFPSFAAASSAPTFGSSLFTSSPASESAPTTASSPSPFGFGSTGFSFAQSTAPAPSLFGASATSAAATTPSLFGAASSAPSTPSLFGAPASSAASTTSAAATTPTLFCAPTPTLFGATSSAAATPSLFGTTSAAAAAATPSLFGAVSSAASTPNLFSGASTGFGFGSSASSFATTTTTATTPSFGFASNTAPAASSTATTSASAPALGFGATTGSGLFGSNSSAPLFGTTTASFSATTATTTPSLGFSSSPATTASTPSFGFTPPSASTTTASTAPSLFSSAPSASAFSFPKSASATPTTPASAPSTGFSLATSQAASAPSLFSNTGAAASSSASSLSFPFGSSSATSRPKIASVSATTAFTVPSATAAPASSGSLISVPTQASSTGGFSFTVAPSSSSSAAVTATTTTVTSSSTSAPTTTTTTAFPSFSLQATTPASASTSATQSILFGSSTTAASTSATSTTTSQATSSAVQASSTGPTTSAITPAASQAPKLPSEIVGKGVEQVIRDWNNELQDRTAKFCKHATAIAEWDRRILQNRNVPIRLETEVAKVVETQTSLERQLELIDTHQREMSESEDFNENAVQNSDALMCLNQLHNLEQLRQLAMWGQQHEQRYLNKEQPIQNGYSWTVEMLNHKRSCYKMFRMSRKLFDLLHDTLVGTYDLASTRDMTSLESLAMFLWILGGVNSFAVAEVRFCRSTHTVHTKFYEVLECIYKMSEFIIMPKDPTFSVVHPKLLEPRFYPHFNGCIGAIDGTHIKTIVPADKSIMYRNRHGYTSQNVMAFCDFDMRFTFVVAGWAGSVHDTRVFNAAKETFASKFPTPPAGKYYLVDSGYPNRTGYLAPYKGTKYHLPEFRISRRPTGKFEVFNHAHSSLRNVIERSFGVLKMKWRILLDVPCYPVETQTKIIHACMALHNFIRDSALADKEFDKCDADEDYIPEVHDLTGGDDNTNGVGMDENNWTIIREGIANSLLTSRMC